MTRAGILLTVATSLAAFGLLGMYRSGGGTDDASRRAGTTVITASRGYATTMTPTVTPAPDWTPTPQPGLSRALESGETVQALPVAVWRDSLVIPDHLRYELVRACFCESRFTPAAVGAAGELGQCQVLARFHGPVPADSRGQFEQAARIAERHGMAPWTTRDGCAEWRAS